MAADNISPFGIELYQRFRHTLDIGRVKDPKKIFSCACGIGQRPQYVEDRSVVYRLPYRHDVFHRRVVVHCKDKAEACLFKHFYLIFHRKIKVDPQSFKYIGRTGIGSNGTVPVLGDHGTERGKQKGDRGRDVERTAFIPACTDDVDRFFSQFIGERQFDRMFTHHRCRSGYVRPALPFFVKVNEELTCFAFRHLVVKEFFKLLFYIHSHSLHHIP